MFVVPCQAIMQSAPLRLLMLEFQSPEEKFLQNVDIATEAIVQQQQAIEDKANIKDILRKHKVCNKNIVIRYQSY